MFEGMTDKGRYNREAPARIFHSSAGSNPNFQRKPHVEKPYKSKPKRQTPLNHLPEEFHGRPFSRNLYLTSRSQIFEKKKKRNLYLKRLERLHYERAKRNLHERGWKLTGLPSRGTASEVAGIVSATIFRNTVRDKRMVTPAKEVRSTN